MIYTVIEDCSPFYIRFTWDGLTDLINLAKLYPLPKQSVFGYSYIRTNESFRKAVFERLPIGSQLALNKNRVAFLVSDPGFYYGPHKDGMDHRVSLNIGIKILDDNCITSWYREDELQSYEITSTEFPSLGPDYPKLPGSSREILNWDETKHQPVKTMIAKPNEAVLFNTDIYHSWDNRTSENQRVVLAFRHSNPGIFYFEDVRKILFGY
jgi:hypothetical protein